MPRCDAVFEGGGVKGIGLVGAIAVTEELGYEFVNLAGTSAGAIVAALIAAGYNATELRDIMQHLDYSQFKDQGLLDDIPVFGKILSLGLEKGIYEGEYLEAWIRKKLAAKGKHTFKDLILARLYPFMPHSRGYQSSGSAMRRGFPPYRLSSVTWENVSESTSAGARWRWHPQRSAEVCDTTRLA
jgi:Patatin-like phospholipase